MTKATLALAEEQAKATLALELEAAEEAAGLLEKRLNSARREVTHAYLAAFGSQDAPAERGPALATLIAETRATITEAMDGTGQAAGEVLEEYAKKAAQLGAEHAAVIVDEASSLDAPEADLSGARAAPGVVEQARKDSSRMLSQALVLGAGYAGVMAVVGRANRATSDLRATARTTVNSVRNESVHEVAEAHGYGRVWVTEEDGCVECQAYAGQVAWVGEDFPGGLTFGTSEPRNTDPLPDPPLHPNCRCEVMPYSESDGPAFPDALKREAKRSILKGWSVDSESETVRLKAAQKLLNRGAGLPKSVEEASARALKRGKFPSRRVPRFTR